MSDSRETDDRSLEARTRSWARVAAAQQLLLGVLGGACLFMWSSQGSEQNTCLATLESHSAQLNALSARLAMLETRTVHEHPNMYRQLSQSEDRATIRVDAPDGIAQFVMGATSAADNVVMEKQHVRDGGAFTLSRNLNPVFDISVAV